MLTKEYIKEGPLNGRKITPDERTEMQKRLKSSKNGK